jgi:hypothetical protein
MSYMSKLMACVLFSNSLFTSYGHNVRLSKVVEKDRDVLYHLTLVSTF